MLSNSWFRLYAEFSTDPKVQMLSEAQQRRLIMLFCARCNGHVTLQDNEVTFLLRITPEEWAETKSIFIAKNFIDSDNNILHWDKRQFRSDSSKERVARHRSRIKQDDVTTCNVTVTPQNRTDTEQIQRRDISSEDKSSSDICAHPWLPKSLWDSWCEMRKKKDGKAFTEHAKALAINKLDALRTKGHDPTEILENAIIGSWKSFYEPGNKNANITNTNQSKQVARQSSFNALYAAGSEYKRKQSDSSSEAMPGEHTPGIASRGKPTSFQALPSVS